MIINNYNGAKFRYVGTEEYYDDLGFKQTRAKFKMTRSYLEYLAEKNAEEAKMQIVTLKNKLEYQQKTYGEVDPYDLNEYMRLVQAQYIDLSK